MDNKTFILISDIAINTEGKYAIKVQDFHIVYSQVPEFTIHVIHPCYNKKKVTKNLRYAV